MRQRIITALVLLPLAIGGVLWLPSRVFLAVVAALLLLGLWEWTRLAGLPKLHQRAGVIMLNALLLAALAWRGWPHTAMTVAVLGCAWWLFAALWLGRFRWAQQRSRGNTLIKLAIGSLLVLPAWSGVALLHASGERGPQWLLYALLLVWAADTFAFFVGSRIGGRKLAPSISPGKTWAGFWGGLAGVALVATAAVPVFDLAWSRWPSMLFAALLVGLAAVVGDLYESLIKRHSGAKDSGHLVPGHGGVMDRLDSLVAAVPVFAVLKIWLGL